MQWFIIRKLLLKLVHRLLSTFWVSDTLTLNSFKWKLCISMSNLLTTVSNILVSRIYYFVSFIELSIWRAVNYLRITLDTFNQDVLVLALFIKSKHKYVAFDITTDKTSLIQRAYCVDSASMFFNLLILPSP